MALPPVDARALAHRADRDLHLGDARAHPFHVAGKGIAEQVLARSVQLQLLGDFGALDEGIPGELVNPLALLAFFSAYVLLGLVEVAVEELQENPLRPFVIKWITGLYLPVPIV